MSKKVNIRKFRELANLSGVTDAQMVSVIQSVCTRFTKYDFSKVMSGRYATSLAKEAEDILIKRFPEIAERCCAAPRAEKKANRKLNRCLTLRVTDEEADRFQRLCDATGRTKQDMLRYIVNRETDGIDEWIDQVQAVDCSGVVVEGLQT